MSQLGLGSTIVDDDANDLDGLVAGCHITITPDSPNPGDATIAVKPSTLAGDGLVSTVVEPPACPQLAVNPGDGIQIIADAVAVKVSDFAGTGLEANNGDLRIAASAAGDGLTGGGGSALAVNPGNGIDLVSDAVQVAPSEIAGLGLESDGATPPKLRTKAVIRDTTYKYILEIDGSAASAKPKRAFQRVESAGAIIGIYLNISNTIAGDNTNNFEVFIRRQAADGSGETTVCDFVNNVANGGCVALVTKDLTSLGVNLTGFVAGDVLTIQVIKNGTGQAVNGLSVYVVFEKTG